MNSHISKSGKNVDSRNSHSVPTSVRKATTFLNDEYLKDLSAASDDNYFISIVIATTVLEKTILRTT